MVKYCYCSAVRSNPPQENCDDCLVAIKQISGCGQGLMPCGGAEGTASINLNTLNKNAADVIYSLKPNGYSSDDFASVSISSAGIVTLVTGEAYESHGLHPIEYMVTKGKFKNYGTLFVCFDSPCEDECGESCNTCSGECYGSIDDQEMTLDCNEAGATLNLGALLNLGACDGTNTFTLAVPVEIAASITSGGLLTVEATGAALPGVTYTIDWDLACSKYGLTASGKIEVYIDDKCTETTCDPGFTCNKCTGECEEMTSDLSITKSGMGIQSSGGVVIS